MAATATEPGTATFSQLGDLEITHSGKSERVLEFWVRTLLKMRRNNDPQIRLVAERSLGLLFGFRVYKTRVGLLVESLRTPPGVYRNHRQFFKAPWDPLLEGVPPERYQSLQRACQVRVKLMNSDGETVARGNAVLDSAIGGAVIVEGGPLEAAVFRYGLAGPRFEERLRQHTYGRVSRKDPQLTRVVMRTLLGLDGSKHQVRRRDVARAFRGEELAAKKRPIQTIANAALSAVSKNTAPNVDILTDAIEPFAREVIQQVLGFPAEHQQILKQLGKLGPGFIDPRIGVSQQELLKWGAKFRHVVDAVIEATIADPSVQGAELQQLIRSRIKENGGELDHGLRESIHSDALLILVAGFITTKSYLASVVDRLSRNPDELKSFEVACRSRDRQAIETYFDRTIAEDPPVRLIGRRLPDGWTLRADTGAETQKVTLDVRAINASYINEGESLRRSFGAGSHYCIGDRLAKEEFVSFFIALFDRFRIEPHSSGVKLGPSLVLPEVKVIRVGMRPLDMRQRVAGFVTRVFTTGSNCGVFRPPGL